MFKLIWWSLALAAGASIGLKVGGAIDWSWWVVLLPLAAFLIASFVGGVAALGIAIRLGAAMEDRR